MRKFVTQLDQMRILHMNPFKSYTILKPALKKPYEYGHQLLNMTAHAQMIAQLRESRSRKAHSLSCQFMLHISMKNFSPNLTSLCQNVFWRKMLITSFLTHGDLSDLETEFALDNVWLSWKSRCLYPNSFRSSTSTKQQKLNLRIRWELSS